ncbi:MAG: class I lanthipeptide [Candidatus Krumholzibacteriia bacterium]
MKQLKKLSLHKETLRRLTDEELARVGGALIPNPRLSHIDWQTDCPKIRCVEFTEICPTQQDDYTCSYC